MCVCESERERERERGEKNNYVFFFVLISDRVVIDSLLIFCVRHFFKEDLHSEFFVCLPIKINTTVVRVNKISESCFQSLKALLLRKLQF